MVKDPLTRTKKWQDVPSNFKKRFGEIIKSEETPQWIKDVDNTVSDHSLWWNAVWRTHGNIRSESILNASQSMMLICVEDSSKSSVNTESSFNTPEPKPDKRTADGAPTTRKFPAYDPVRDTF